MTVATLAVPRHAEVRAREAVPRLNAIFKGMFIEASFSRPPRTRCRTSSWSHVVDPAPIAAFFLFANVMALGEGKTKGKKKQSARLGGPRDADG